MALHEKDPSTAALKPGDGRRAARRVLIFWAVVAVAACFGSQSFWRTLIEAGIYLVLLGFALRQELVLRTLESLRSPERAFLALLFALVLFGQLLGRSAATYPFSSWNYTRPVDPDQHYYDYTGVLADGREIPLRTSRELPIVCRQLPFRLTITANRIYGTTNAPRRAKLMGEYEPTLRALGLKHNADHPDTRLVAVRAWRHSFNLENYQQTGSTTRKLFVETALPAGKGTDAP